MSIEPSEKDNNIKKDGKAGMNVSSPKPVKLLPSAPKPQQIKSPSNKPSPKKS